MTPDLEREPVDERNSDAPMYYISVLDERGKVRVLNIGSDLSVEEIGDISDETIVTTYTLYTEVLDELRERRYNAKPISQPYH